MKLRIKVSPALLYLLPFERLWRISINNFILFIFKKTYCAFEIMVFIEDSIFKDISFWTVICPLFFGEGAYRNDNFLIVTKYYCTKSSSRYLCLTFKR